ncbi:hypothetical protein K0M31_012406 [Melipona bicolor]|uniref:Lipid storage droplets surface-binding protein 1 n=1 Tax=Melipona bicolor TaxID=60889 RepID=A0AA40KHD9_9HYME|nr:hypothetical protein K0M31_012406 [Melipona bicolor]
MGTNVKRRHSDLPHFKSVTRISNLPIVEYSINIAGNAYARIKRSNSLVDWSLCTAENSFAIATASAKPIANAISVLNGPITTIDQLLCKGIDIVEQRVPAVHLPPHLMYRSAREYVNVKIVRPVLTRAESVKEIGSQAANAAADRLDGALTVADKYVDHYLPADVTDGVDDVSSSESVSKTKRTIKRGAKLSKKLQHRLTRRTLAEARALKDQGTECIHILLYIVELLATDPKLAFQKAKELWKTLSLPEPENQARPTTLEQLLVLLTRESARRIVHLVNGAATLASETPNSLAGLLITVACQLSMVVDATLEMMSAIGKKILGREQISAIYTVIDRLNSITNRLLERFAAFLAGRPTVSKVTNVESHQQNHNNHTSVSSNPAVNGIE